MAYPIESPITAPITAAAPTPTGLTASSCRDDSSAALTRTISPGSGMPRLSSPTTTPTTTYTVSGGMDCKRASTVMAKECPTLSRGAAHCPIFRARPAAPVRSGGGRHDLLATLRRPLHHVDPALGVARSQASVSHPFCTASQVGFLLCRK